MYDYYKIYVYVQSYQTTYPDAEEGNSFNLKSGPPISSPPKIVP